VGLDIGLLVVAVSVLSGVRVLRVEFHAILFNVLESSWQVTTITSVIVLVTVNNLLRSQLDQRVASYENKV
jgi:hypothetical protein